MALLIFFEVHDIHPLHANKKDMSRMCFTNFSASIVFLDFDSHHRWFFRWISKVAARSKNKVFAQTCHLVRVLPHPCDLLWVPGSLLRSWSSLLRLNGAVAQDCLCSRRLHCCLPLGEFLLCLQTHGMVPALTLAFVAWCETSFSPSTFPEVWVSVGRQHAQMLVSFVAQERQ